MLTKEMFGLIAELSKQYKVNRNIVIAQIKAESNFNENAESRVGAKGLCQFMPATFQECKEKMKRKGITIGNGNIWDVETQIRCHFFYMYDEIPRLLKHFKIPNTYEMRLRCYNAGIGNVMKSFNFDETNNYVEKILKKNNMTILIVVLTVAVFLIFKFKK